MSPLVRPDERGLACDAGAFHIDPWRPVPLAVITHAHADHARPGSGRYVCARDGEPLLRARMGKAARITPLDYGQPAVLRGPAAAAEVTLLPAGHVLGSAQVRVRACEGRTGDDRTWIVSGDYARLPNPTCQPFEAAACDVFVTESTFGLPIYRWPKPEDEFARLNAWWRDNARNGRTSVVLAYALGKAQRVLASLDTTIGPIGVHGAVDALLDGYRCAGVALPPVVRATGEGRDALRGEGLVVAPPSVMGTPWLRRLAARGLRTAMASGWMAVRGRRRWRSVDAGFVLSDHADWPGLLDTIEATGARTVGVTHGSSEPLARFLRERRGLDAFAITTRYAGDDEHAQADTTDGGGS